MRQWVCHESKPRKPPRRFLVLCLPAVLEEPPFPSGTCLKMKLTKSAPLSLSGSFVAATKKGTYIYIYIYIIYNIYIYIYIFIYIIYILYIYIYIYMYEGWTINNAGYCSNFG